jgi:hypothetical protein
MKVKKFAFRAPALSQRVGALRSLGKALPLSLVATATLHAAVQVPGFLKYEYFPGATRPTVEDGTAGAPSTAGNVQGSDKSGFAPALESGTNFADNYANRFSGFFIPPATGKYVFFIAADDDSDLFLSTDASPANKKLIAQEAGWSGVRNYTAVGGTSLPEDKRSDSFSLSEWPTGGAEISLTAGEKYYIEAVHHEGTGGDNLAVTYKLATEPDPADGSAPRLAGSVIAVEVDAAPPAPNVNVTVQPVGGTFYVNQPLSLLVVASSASTFPLQYNGP